MIQISIWPEFKLAVLSLMRQSRSVKGDKNMKKTLLTKDSITGLILTGGAGRRIGGLDKGLLSYSGSTLIQRQIEWLKPQVKTLLISANRNISQYEKSGYPVLQDSNKGYQGPLCGLLKALERCATDWLFIQPIDVPHLPKDLIEKVVEKILTVNLNKKTKCFYLVTDQREHYLSMLIEQKSLQELQQFLNAGNKRVRDFHRNIGSVAIDLNLKEEDFKNMNFQSDYQ